MERKLLIVLAIMCLILNSGLVYSGSIVKAKYAGEFMAIGVGSRALGMGGAFVAVGNDVTAGYWNPAGLTQLMYPEIIGMHAQLFANIVNYNYGAIALPFGSNSTFALSVIRLGVDDIPNTNQALLDYGMNGIPGDGDPGEGNGIIDEGERIDPNKVFYFNSAEYGVYLSYGRWRNRNLSYGGNVKVIKKGIGDEAAWGMGFDVAALWQPQQNWKLACNLQDITTTLLVWETGRQEAILPTAKLGAAYFWQSSKIAGRIIPAVDIDLRFENRRYAAQFNVGSVSFDSHIGLEYQFRQIMAVRLGLDVGRFAAGIGFKLPKLNVDYAFVSHDELGETHRISLKVSIEEKKFARRVR